MRVVTDDGASIELGELQSAPTVGIIDYSRRVTDDFGVTTVVQRGFARRMQVRLAVPFENVDTVAQQLAELRATPAQWIADDRFQSLAFRGFYKEFELDLATEPLSFCTLTVEGMVGAEAVADDGGDPSPVGQPSTLQLLLPIDVTDAILASSTVPEADQLTWSATTTYARGARVIKMATHRVYESLVAGNAGHDPALDSANWLDVGPTNRWAMFDAALGTATTAASKIAVTLGADAIGAVALLDLAGDTVRVQGTGYDRTQVIGTGTMTFLDLPANVGAITVTIAGAAVSVGTLLIGKIAALGLTEASPTAGINDYSRKAVDDFGAVSVVKRAFAKRMTAVALLRTDAVDAVSNRLASVRAHPSLWIGQAGIDSLTIYGFFKEFSIEVGETLSKLSLSIEGLSAAAKLEPLRAAIDWSDVGNPDGKKPADNATNSADPASAFGPDASVGDALQQAKDLLATAEALLTSAVNQTLAAERQRARVARQTYIDGAAMGAVVRNEVAKSDDLIETVDLIGIKTAGGTAFVINADTVRFSPTESFAQRFSSISASLGQNSTSLDSLVTTVATETSARVTQYTGLNARVGSNESNVSILYSSLANETSARSMAVSNLTASVTIVQGNLNAAVSSLQQADASETSARAIAISNLSARVDTNQSNTSASITQLQQADATETSARAAAVSNLAARVDTNQSNTSASITQLQHADATETSARAGRGEQPVGPGRHEPVEHQRIDLAAPAGGRERDVGTDGSGQ